MGEGNGRPNRTSFSHLKTSVSDVKAEAEKSQSKKPSVTAEGRLKGLSESQQYREKDCASLVLHVPRPHYDEDNDSGMTNDVIPNAAALQVKEEVQWYDDLVREDSVCVPHEKEEVEVKHSKGTARRKNHRRTMKTTPPFNEESYPLMAHQ